MERIKIVIADDHALVLEALLLLSEGAFEIAGKAYDGNQLVELGDVVKPDVWLVDINMPGLDGFEAARQLLQRNPAARILFISGECSARLIRESQGVGGYGFLSKHASYAEFAAAIEAVANGQKILGFSAKEELERHSESALACLTPRQIAVLQLIAEGLTAKEIAFKLGLSPRTAEFHRQCIMERLDLHSTAELTRFAIGEGLINAGLNPPRTMAAQPGM